MEVMTLDSSQLFLVSAHKHNRKSTVVQVVIKRKRDNLGRLAAIPIIP